MSLSHRYAHFSENAGLSSEVEDSAADALEDLKLAAFDTGYQAGWDDATAAWSKEQSRLSDELTQTFQTIEFTHREAAAQVAQALGPLMAQLSAKILPAIAHDMIGPHIVAELDAMITDGLDVPVEIFVAPARKAAVRRLLQSQPKALFSLRTDPDLSPDSARLRVAGSERVIDVGGVVAAIGSAMAAYFQTIEKELDDD